MREISPENQESSVSYKHSITFLLIKSRVNQKIRFDQKNTCPLAKCFCTRNMIFNQSKSRPNLCILPRLLRGENFVQRAGVRRVPVMSHCVAHFAHLQKRKLLAFKTWEPNHRPIFPTAPPECVASETGRCRDSSVSPPFDGSYASLLPAAVALRPLRRSLTRLAMRRTRARTENDEYKKYFCILLIDYGT